MGRRSDHTREEIRAMALQATEKLLEKSGLAGLTARKVASAIGYTVGTLYLVFRNQDDLIQQANARTLDTLYRRLTALDTRADPHAGLRALAREYLRFALAHTHRWSAIFDHTPANQQLAPAWYNERVDRLFAVPESALQALDPQRKPHAVTLAARALWAGVHGVVVLSLKDKLALGDHNRQPAVIEELVDSLVTNYLVGYQSH